MREYIFDGGDIEQNFLAGNYQEVVTALNTATQKQPKTGEDGRKPGYVSNATMGRDLGQAAVATFLTVLENTIAVLSDGTALDKAQANLLRSFVDRFNTTADGIDFKNEEIRQQVAAIFQAAGVGFESYLSLGYTLVSPAMVGLGRGATIDDVMGIVWAVNAEEHRTKFAVLWNEHVSPVIGNKAEFKAGLHAIADLF